MVVASGNLCTIDGMLVNIDERKGRGRSVGEFRLNTLIKMFPNELFSEGDGTPGPTFRKPVHPERYSVEDRLP